MTLKDRALGLDGNFHGYGGVNLETFLLKVTVHLPKSVISFYRLAGRKEPV